MPTIKSGCIEVYSKKHAMSFTGHAVKGRSLEIVQADDWVKGIHDKYGRTIEEAPDDDPRFNKPVVDDFDTVKINIAADLAFMELFNRKIDDHPKEDHSTVDYHLCVKMRKFTALNLGQMKRLFLASPRSNPVFSTKRKIPGKGSDLKYIERTMKKALLVDQSQIPLKDWIVPQIDIGPMLEAQGFAKGTKPPVNPDKPSVNREKPETAPLTASVNRNDPVVTQQALVPVHTIGNQTIQGTGCNTGTSRLFS